ncbi:MAG: hypothetical protein FWC50_12055 [Planctomycetaceae bacterium]|nr:hypothetical protein [Planctomycetaceae bacterium]
MNEHRVKKWHSLFSMTAFLLIMFFMTQVMMQNVPAQSETAKLAKEFSKPDKLFQPWVYWFWNNGNLTKEGITADLEAMQRVGIKGVLIMEVGQDAPKGPVDFLSDEWRALFHFMITEADRCGIEVNMNNDAGWNGSGGTWIKPDEAMQILCRTETNVKHGDSDIKLPQPEIRHGYYRDIAVFAFPAPKNPAGKEPVDPDANRRHTPNSQVPEDAVVPQNKVVILENKISADGTLDWDVPEGDWTVVRMGHTCKGAMVAPAPESGVGLECDKLSVKGTDAAFAGQIGRLADENKNFVGKIFLSTHIDSWENGSQNWTETMREEFQKRRGYDLFPMMPVFAGYVVESTDVTERFLWDFRRTVSEMVMDNHVRRMRDLAHQHGLKLSIEAYGSPCDHIQYAGICDEPMGEFWIGGSAIETCRGMASAGHVYGKPVIGAEAFTANDSERWLQHPGSMKTLGDRAFCEGINRFVFHRYSFQPWRDVKPGLMMGPWGVHYERTQTWWNLTPAWHEYLTRSQYMLRQGGYVADICYVEPEDSPQGFSNHPQTGYPWDQCGTDAVLQMSVKNGNLALPGGMTYRLLVLPNSDRMTLELVKKVGELVRNGATILGNRPNASFGLTDYPDRDKQVAALAGELWGESQEKSGERKVGQGRIVWGETEETVLQQMGVPMDFDADRPLNHIHRRTRDADIYFVANPENSFALARVTFRAEGQPELWHPETGKITPLSAWHTHDGVTAVLLPLKSTESVFVVFRKDSEKNGDVEKNKDAVIAISLDGKLLGDLNESAPPILVKRAVYGVPGDAGVTRDVTEIVSRMVAQNGRVIPVAKIAVSGDPKFGVVKTPVEIGGTRLR